MKLDRNKKYTGFGFTWEWKGQNLKRWMTLEMEWDGAYVAGSVSEPVMQAWLEAGHIKPVRETKIVRVEGVQVQVVRSRDGGLQLGDLAVVSGYCAYDLPRLAVSKHVTLEFEVEA